MKADKILGIFLLVFSAVYNTQLYGQTLEQKLKECSEITVSLIRLQCYDRITENPEVQSAKPVRERTGLLSRLGRSSENTNDEREEKDAETEVVVLKLVIFGTIAVGGTQYEEGKEQYFVYNI